MHETRSADARKTLNTLGSAQGFPSSFNVVGLICRPKHAYSYAVKYVILLATLGTWDHSIGNSSGHYSAASQRLEAEAEGRGAWMAGSEAQGWATSPDLPSVLFVEEGTAIRVLMLIQSPCPTYGSFEDLGG